MGKVVSFYGNKDPREVPLYAAPHVASHLRIPVSTIRAWVRANLIKPSTDGLLSFNTLTEAYVLATLRREYKFSMRKIVETMECVESSFGKRRPLLNADLITDGTILFLVEENGQTFDVMDSKRQSVIVQVMTASLHRIERDMEGAPRVLYPYLEKPTEKQLISIDPRRSFGRPVVADTSILVEVLAERFRSGESKAVLMNDYQLTAEKVNAAIKWHSDRQAA